MRVVDWLSAVHHMTPAQNSVDEANELVGLGERPSRCIMRRMQVRPLRHIATAGYGVSNGGHSGAKHGPSRLSAQPGHAAHPPGGVMKQHERGGCI